MYTSDKYTSDKPEGERRYFAAVGAYLLATALCALFGAVYELFSHEVYSYCMIYAFIFPLLLGAAPFFLRHRAGLPFPAPAAADCVHCGVAAVTMGSLMAGVMEIYGTTSPLIKWYFIAGVPLTLIGWLLAVLRSKDKSPE